MFAATLSGNAKTTLALLGKSGIFKDAYLAGGSALALHLGHRYSIDFDFFTPKKFSPLNLSGQLGKICRFKKEGARGISLIGTINEVKLSYFQYDYPLLARTTLFLNINIAGIADIAAMKIAAIMDRGTKKDFVDLFELVRNGLEVEKTFSFYENKYGKLGNNIYSIIKSLQYFDDAEKSEMPRMIKMVSWERVKDFFAQESLRLGKKYL